jgi:hypothetical protein
VSRTWVQPMLPTFQEEIKVGDRVRFREVVVDIDDTDPDWVERVYGLIGQDGVVADIDWPQEDDCTYYVLFDEGSDLLMHRDELEKL